MRRLSVLLLIPTVGCLDYDRFLLKKNAKACEIVKQCNPEIDCEDDTGIGAESCDFDAGAARDCIGGVWSCDDASVGFEYAVPPQACETVCRPPAE